METNILQIMVPMHISHTIPPSLNVCTVVQKLSSAMYPCKLFHCLPRCPTTYTCLLPITCLLVNVCIFFCLINQTFIKQECFQYFPNAGWGHTSLCLFLRTHLESMHAHQSLKTKTNPVRFTIHWDKFISEYFLKQTERTILSTVKKK